MRKPATKCNTASNIHFFRWRHEKTCFSTYKCTKYKRFWRVMRKPATKWNNASNIRDFGASWKKLLRNVIMHQMYTFFRSRHERNCFFTYQCTKYKSFWRVMRKPAFLCNNATKEHLFCASWEKPAFPHNNASNIRVFGASWENLLRIVIMHQIYTFSVASLENLLFHV